MSDLVLYIGDKNLSSWSMRPWVAMRQAGIPFEERVLLFDTPGWRDTIASHSPSRRVPALRHGDLAVWDSLAICEYVAELHPSAGLWPDDRAARARARAVAAEMHSGFAAMRRDLSMDVVGRGRTYPQGEDTLSDLARVKEIWSECRARHAGEGPFLFGRFSIADAMYAPVVFRFRTYGVGIEDPAVRSWYETMLALPAVRAWEADAAVEVKVRPSPDPTQKGGVPSPSSATDCYAVVFSSQRRRGEGGAEPADGYGEMTDAMAELAAKQPGYLGIESARGADGFGITVSYWASLDAIRRWKDNTKHEMAQARGRELYYERYRVRICRVERGYQFPKE